MSGRRGPLIHRRARLGGFLVGVGSLQFVVAMAVAEYAYPGYSLTQNHVSDLGGPGSPWAFVFNDSVRLLGVLAVVGAILLRTAFPEKTRGQVGLGLLAVGGIGAFLVGIYPVGSPELGGNIHDLVALITFAAGSLSLLALSVAMLRDTRWEGMRAYTALSGLVAVTALLLSVRGAYLGIGPGGMERLIVAPILLWGILAGVHLLRLPTYQPTPIPLSSP